MIRTKEELRNGFTLHHHGTDKFKTDILALYIAKPLRKDEITKDTLLTSVLRRITRKYDKMSKLEQALDSLYGARLSVSSFIVGEKSVLQFAMTFVDDRYLDEEILERCAHLLLDVVFDPWEKDGAFREDVVHLEKNVLKENIEAKINDKQRYALHRMIETMCEGESASISEDGYLEDIPDITEQNLFDHYRKVLAEGHRNFFLAGNGDISVIKAVCEQRIPLDDHTPCTFEESSYLHEVGEVRYVTEQREVVQSNLVLGLRNNTAPQSVPYTKFLLYCRVLGVGAHSKLFRNVRERHSLCYSVSAIPLRSYGIFCIRAGISPEKYEKALATILDEVKAMKDGRITQQELDQAKSASIQSIVASEDSLSATVSLEYGQTLRNERYSGEELIAMIEDVTIEDLVEVAQRVELDTVYLLTAKEAVTSAEDRV